MWYDLYFDLADSRIVWYGVAMGALVGILLMVLDEAVAKQPMLQVVECVVMTVLRKCIVFAYFCSFPCTVINTI